jgi:mRNA interferase MazF
MHSQISSAELTSQPQKAGFPLTPELSNPELPRRSWEKINQTRTLSTERPGKRIARLSERELNFVIEGLNEMIGS